MWAERTGSEIVRNKPGADPAAVVFDAIVAAKARGVDFVLADTAGRQHAKGNLMAELHKTIRSAEKALGRRPDEVLLVLDANTGQNAIRQAEEFTKSAGVTGLVLTKLDGTARGGRAHRGLRPASGADQARGDGREGGEPQGLPARRLRVQPLRLGGHRSVGDSSLIAPKLAMDRKLASLPVSDADVQVMLETTPSIFGGSVRLPPSTLRAACGTSQMGKGKDTWVGRRV